MSAQTQCWNAKYLELQFLIVMATRGDDEVKDRVCEWVCSFDWNEMLDVHGTNATIGWYLCSNVNMVAAMVKTTSPNIAEAYCNKLKECNFNFHPDTGPNEGVTITRLLLSSKAFVKRCRFISDLYAKLFAADWTISPKSKNNHSNLPLVLLYYKNDDDLPEGPYNEVAEFQPKLLEADWEETFDCEPNSILAMVANHFHLDSVSGEVFKKLCDFDWNMPGNEEIKFDCFKNFGEAKDFMYDDSSLDNIKLNLSI